MPSARYTRNINPDDLKPEKKRELTKKEKLENFFYYYKWHMIIAAAAIAFIIYTIVEITSVVSPDYNIMLISANTYPDAIVERLETAVQQYAEDLNDDGSVIVTVNQYNVSMGGIEVDYNRQMAGSTRIMADMQEGTSMIVLTDDVKSLYAEMPVLGYLDGSYMEPSAENIDFSKLCKSLTESKLAKSLLFTESQTEEMSGYEFSAQQLNDMCARLVMGFRFSEGTFFADNEKTMEYYEASKQLFEKIA